MYTSRSDARVPLRVWMGTGKKGDALFDGDISVDEDAALCICSNLPSSSQSIRGG